jgi:hypothetical protein
MILTKFYAHYIDKKLTMPCGNLPDLLFGLGHWFSFCGKKPLPSLTKTYMQRNQRIGVKRLALKHMFTSNYTLYREESQINGPKARHATRKSPEHIVWVRALVFISCKEHPPKSWFFFTKLYAFYIKTKMPVQKWP